MRGKPRRLLSFAPRPIRPRRNSLTNRRRISALFTTRTGQSRLMRHRAADCRARRAHVPGRGVALFASARTSAMADRCRPSPLRPRQASKWYRTPPSSLVQLVARPSSDIGNGLLSHALEQSAQCRLSRRSAAPPTYPPPDAEWLNRAGRAVQAAAMGSVNGFPGASGNEKDAPRAAVRTIVIGQPDPRRDNIITPEAGTLRNHLSLHRNRCQTRMATPRLV